MSNKIKNLTCHRSLTTLNEELSFAIEENSFEKFTKSIRKERNFLKKRKKRFCHIKSSKGLGIITMQEFIENYLEIDGEALKQMKNMTHDDLEKMCFKEVQRVPFELANGFGTEFFIVVDVNNNKITYRNPKEKIRIENVKYENKNSKCLEKNMFPIEYEEEFTADDLEEEINKNYSDGGICYAKYKKE